MSAILPTTWSLIDELKFVQYDRRAFLPSISFSLNEATIELHGPRTDGIARSPLEVMTGIEPKRRILRVLPADINLENYKTISDALSQKSSRSTL